MAQETWAEYVQRATAGMSQQQIADKTGLEKTGISRWLRGMNVPRAESVVTFARCLGLPPVDALIAAGYLTIDEFPKVVHTRGTISDYSTDELLAEIRRRTV
jgi:transcriptional regulator with XRE-family HTH domain